ncbi:hypothetical protein A5906_05110 [Bradyrhizobium sacchari]|uniref:Carnitine 3-dehydrogenase n=1 Tax=Bradyrhizobium sacchari TaxID=1399419 RepID=A0A560J4I9_9BRAD|nr:3-hydroxyacyl-CoA dehydrogenase NAD-binding domain-containing protein [Bradyrhizobium sacchari]OPY96043.1 hypothetical protein A5906_05110 [Bradyrhizobium sacchari]TWB47253.1 carnitine 3-dehydrogenase [Bradyrhizobium sacchari]TWB66031.1 carnitine 3-dehydrogenase [Bradyrhizobium sacchari]
MLETSNINEKLPRAVGLLGGGVIGSGWAARFLLNGVDVRLYGPSPDAVERVQKTLADARRAYRELTLMPLPPEGSLTVVESVADAVRGVDLVQESAPESLELKQELLAAASRAAAHGTLICSSTSGFRPSLLQAEMDRPERLLVARPSQPVYLLPLIELCAGERTASEALERATTIYEAIGMHPLVVRQEVDGFIANRLQGAISCEALWLVHDDVATLQDIDDALRYSLALRHATMEPYRMAGGRKGLRQNIEQCALWPRLTETPDIDGAFLGKAVEQVDALVKSDPLDAPAVQKRDDLIVALLHALRSQGYGPGETVARWERSLRDRTPPQTNCSGPLRMPTVEMPSHWSDYSGHIKQSHYLQLISNASDALLRSIGIDCEYRSNSGNYYTAETHLTHLRELHAGDRVRVLTQVLGVDDKRLHLYQAITREGDDRPAATGEQMLIHVDPTSRRSAPAKGRVREQLLELVRLHAKLPRPERAGAGIGMR